MMAWQPSLSGPDAGAASPLLLRRRFDARIEAARAPRVRDLIACASGN